MVSSSESIWQSILASTQRYIFLDPCSPSSFFFRIHKASCDHLNCPRSPCRVHSCSFSSQDLICIITMPSTRQFFINLRVDIFGSGLKRHKKPVYESRTYRYSSNSTRNFHHGKQRSSTLSTTAPPPTRIPETKKSMDNDRQYDSIPGAWVDDEYLSSSISSAPSYRQAQRDPVPSYNTIRDPVEKKSHTPRGHNTVYIKPMTISNEPMGTRRHLRSGSDVLIVHHPTPQDLDNEKNIGIVTP